MKDPNERLFEKEHIGTQPQHQGNEQDNQEESLQTDEEGNNPDPEDVK